MINKRALDEGSVFSRAQADFGVKGERDALNPVCIHARTADWHECSIIPPLW